MLKVLAPCRKSELSDADKALVRRMVRGAMANAVATEGKNLREARLPSPLRKPACGLSSALYAECWPAFTRVTQLQMLAMIWACMSEAAQQAAACPGVL